MKPTIGRVVNFTNLGSADGKCPPETQAAIVTGLAPTPAGAPSGSEGTFVSLHVFFKPGPFPMLNEDLPCVPFSEEPKRGHWNWPPRV